MSAEQWLKHKSQAYLFYGFAMLCLVLVILTAIIVNSHAPKLDTGVKVGLAPSPPEPVPELGRVETELSYSKATGSNRRRAPQPPHLEGSTMASPKLVPVAKLAVRNTWGERMMAEEGTPPERTVTYESLEDSGTTHIRYRLPYLDLLQRGGPVSGVNSMGSLFKWRFPELSVTVANNTSQLMVLSKARFTIISSAFVRETVLMFDDLSVNDLVIHNEGWAEVRDPVLKLSVSKVLAKGETLLFAPETVTVPINSFTDLTKVPLAKYLPAYLSGEEIVAVSGSISYGEPANRRELAFNTRVSLQIRPGAGIPPSHQYEMMFYAGEASVTRDLALQQQIRPGDADLFSVRLAADKTCHNVVRLEFETVGGEKFDAGGFAIDLFVPRTSDR